MPKLEITTEQAEQLRTIWNSGLRRDELAQRVGLTIDSLLAAKRELGLPNLRRGSRRARGPEVNPTPDEIVAAAAEIRRGWSVEEHAIRQGYRPLETVDTENARKWRIIPISGIVAAWNS
jgi:hypothetical protein